MSGSVRSASQATTCMRTRSSLVWNASGRRRKLMARRVELMTKRREHSLQFKVTLKGLRPPIWRRILVPSEYTFWDLHVAIQDAMGWLDCHLHLFQIRNPVDRTRVELGIPSDEPFFDLPEPLPSWAVPVANYFTLSNRRATYLYDFGDDWQHSVLLEEIAPVDGSRALPACLAGRRRCPPEDCGGIRGFEDLVKVVTDPSHEEHESMLVWLGGPFEPGEFDPAAVRFDDPWERWRIAFEAEPRLVEPARIRVGVDEPVPVAITLEERQLICEHTFADPDLTARLRVSEIRNGELRVSYTLSELDDLQGHIAAAANHADNAALERRLDALYGKIRLYEDQFEDELSPGADT